MAALTIRIVVVAVSFLDFIASFKAVLNFSRIIGNLLRLPDTIAMRAFVEQQMVIRQQFVINSPAPTCADEEACVLPTKGADETSDRKKAMPPSSFRS
jgi:hypothetical protein